MNIVDEVKSFYHSIILNIKNSQMEPSKLIYPKGCACSIEYGREKEYPYIFKIKEY